MLFDPTPEEATEMNKRLKKVFDEAVKSKGCSTCQNIRHVVDYPGFVTGEENECTVGLECDTVLFSVKNCPKYKERKWVDAY
jgi:hypothetical protein